MPSSLWSRFSDLEKASGFGVGGECGLGCIVLVFTAAWVTGAAKRWNTSAMAASYVSAQLKEIDAENASLLLSYDVENKTDLDYRLSDISGTVVMSRLKSTSSLSSQEDIRLSYPTFLPARQRTRVELQVQHPFVWPAENDPAFQDKLKDFVNQRLADVDELVLFDQSDRFQIRFPGGWQELWLASVIER